MRRWGEEDEGKGFLFDRGSRVRAVQAGKNNEVKGSNEQD
jgi:hypothetical protein